jgi:hypothetical protein
MAWQIGVDVGGTFTDLLALDPERGVFRVAKVLSTPEDQSIGFIAGLAELETDLAAVAALVHGHHGRHQCRARTQGSALRADCHLRVSRRARARPPHAP